MMLNFKYFHQDMESLPYLLFNNNICCTITSKIFYEGLYILNESSH